MSTSINGSGDILTLSSTTFTSSPLGASGGAGLVGYLPAGTGAVATTVQSKLRESVSVKDFGAKGDGSTNDLVAINTAVSAFSSDGGTLYFPSGQYRINGPILDSGKPIRFELDAACVIKPTVDTDVFRLTAIRSAVVGQGVIDGSLVSSGTGSGVVVGYGGANAAQVNIDCTIKSMQGYGIKYENGAFLKTDVLIQNCVAGGILCTANYDDNNHGDFLAHIINCTGAGFATVYSATVTLRSRHHHFRQVKTFGCVGGGFDINTEESTGVLFAELNTGFQIRLGANAWGNMLFVTGANGSPDVTESVAGSNFIAGAQGGGYNYSIVRQLIANTLKARNNTYTGSLALAITAANQATLSNDDAVNTNFTLKLTNKDYASGYNLTTEVDKLSFLRGGGTIDRMATGLVNLTFGTVNTFTSTTVGTGFTSGTGATCVITWADTTANLPIGIVLQGSFDKASGALSVIATNVTGANIVVGTARIRYTVFTHF